ncbi:MAG: HD domain-containing protein [Candidatus Tectomicrobia bacterium]|nr:HD domain-containing protein [Candidatus Tectomicrobia bacterium]
MARAAEVKRGERFDGFFRIREIQERQNRFGKPYLDLQLEDRTGCLPAKVWDISDKVVEGPVERGDFVKVRAGAEDFQGALQLRVERIRRVGDADREAGFREEDCVQSTAYDVGLMWEEFRRIAQSCHPLVAALLLSVLDECAERLRAWPASQRIHHPYLGGLLEHTLSVTKTCIYLASKYEVSRDLLVAGAILHDVGKLDELSPVAGTHYTPEGRLLGHLVLGRDIVRAHAQRLGNVPAEFLLHLEHLILSHQGQPEWGTVKVPMTPEALLLHYADDLDAKLNVLRTALEQDRSDEDFTPRHPVMHRHFFKLRPLLPPVAPPEPPAGPGGEGGPPAPPPGERF